jgi:hypothetical protein
MKSLEERIKAAKPDVPELPAGFSDRVMARIAGEGLAELPAPAGHRRRRFSLAGAALLLAVAIVLVNGLAFELRMNGSLELLFFGTRFLGTFLSNLPLDLLVPVLLLSGLAAWLLRYGRAARLATVWVVLIAYGVTGGGGLALAQTGLNERVRDWALQDERDVPMLGPFYRHRARYRMHHRNFRMGRVLEIENGSARILTPAGEEVSVNLPPGLRPRVDEHVRLSGAPVSGRFAAERGQLCEPRRARRYFHHMRMGRGPMMGPGMEMPPGQMGRGPMMGPGGAPRGRGPGMEMPPGQKRRGPMMGPGRGPGMEMPPGQKRRGPMMGPGGGPRGMGPGGGPRGKGPRGMGPERGMRGIPHSFPLPSL